MGKEKWIERIQVNFLEDQRSWIFLPTEVEYLVSLDGINYKRVAHTKLNSIKQDDQVKVEEVAIHLKGKTARFVKIVAKKLGVLPKWHLGYKHEGRSWLFADEIQVK